MSDDWNARLYEDKHAFVWQHAQSLVERLAPQAGETILDLGCGNGHLTAQIAAAGAVVVGLDSSAAMIEEARRHYPGLRFEQADARQLDYQNQFDAVFSNAALHWIREAGQVIHGMARALKPGGRLIVELGGRGNVQHILTALQAAARDLIGREVASPWFFPGIAEYAGMLETARLEVTFAELFDRPTALEGKDGLRDWIRMFGQDFLRQVPETRHDELFRRVEDQVRPLLWRDGQWFADYRRLRIVAGKPC
jgi:trans-aconitate methyltransferase